MAWTTPMTFVDGSILTAPQMNTFLRDNMLETAPGKAIDNSFPQYISSIFVTEAYNSITQRSVVADVVAAAESTDSEDWVDLDTTGPEVTVETGERALYLFTAEVVNDSPDATSYYAVEVSGASSIEPYSGRGARTDGVPNGNRMRVGMARLETNLTPGLNTFTMKYAVATGTATYDSRDLVVIPLS